MAGYAFGEPALRARSAHPCRQGITGKPELPAELVGHDAQIALQPAEPRLRRRLRLQAEGRIRIAGVGMGEHEMPARRQPPRGIEAIDRFGQGAGMDDRIRIEPDARNFPNLARRIGVSLARPARVEHAEPLQLEHQRRNQRLHRAALALARQSPRRRRAIAMAAARRLVVRTTGAAHRIGRRPKRMRAPHLLCDEAFPVCGVLAGLDPHRAPADESSAKKVNSR